jgi:hypothetical protein
LSAGARKRVPTLLVWSKPSSTAALTLNKGIGPVWGFCTWRNIILNSVWKTPPLGALRFSNLSLKALRKILENGLDRLEEKESSTATLPAHDNIRGGQYYQ